MPEKTVDKSAFKKTGTMALPSLVLPPSTADLGLILRRRPYTRRYRKPTVAEQHWFHVIGTQRYAEYHAAMLNRRKAPHLRWVIEEYSKAADAWHEWYNEMLKHYKHFITTRRLRAVVRQGIAKTKRFSRGYFIDVNAPRRL